MKNLRFNELLLMSQSERAAKRVNFHPVSTVIHGNNETGKSTILKSLYSTLGASVPNVLPRWRNARVVSSLRFTVDGADYRALRVDSRYALFDKSDKLVAVASSVTNEWAPQIANLFDFALQLKGQDGLEHQATPAFLFLPFYLDQDMGWTKKLSSFDRLGQFKTPNRDVLQFHFGILPPAYYHTKSLLAAESATQQPLRTEREAGARVQGTLTSRLGNGGFDVDIADFKEQTVELLNRGERLRMEESKLRERMAATFTRLKSVEDQLAIAKHTLHEMQKDRNYSVELAEEVVHCPLCRAEYANGFAERFHIALDEDRVLDLMGDLEEQRIESSADFATAQAGTADAVARAQEVESLLAEKKQSLTLIDVLRSEGRKELDRVMKSRFAEIDEQVGASEAKVGELKRRMKDLQNPKRKKDIESYYQSEMDRLLQKLGVRHLQLKEKVRPDAAIHASGSDLPRAVLAFFLASTRTIAKHSQCAMCPLVVDSPNQQDQDPGNWRLIVETLRDERPLGSQLILATAQDEAADFGGTVITLQSQDKVLQSAEYAGAAEELMPLIQETLHA